MNLAFRVQLLPKTVCSPFSYLIMEKKYDYCASLEFGNIARLTIGTDRIPLRSEDITRSFVVAVTLWFTKYQQDVRLSK